MNIDIKVGNITADPELSYTTSGTAIGKFGLAVNRRYQVDGEWHEHTSFFQVVVWNDLAENVAQSLSKGDRIFVGGRTNQTTWDKDGEKRYGQELVAETIGPDLRFATAQITKITRTHES